MKIQMFARFLLVALVVTGMVACSRKLDDAVVPPGKEDAADASNMRLLSGCCDSQLNLKIIIPAYFEPYTSLWDTMIYNAQCLPGKFYAIINRLNGPWPAYDSLLDERITNFRNAGGSVIVYVNTYRYNENEIRPIDSVKLEVDTWYDWYPGKIDGVFYDQVYPVDGSQVGFYQNLYQYAKAKDANNLVVLNPGANTSENYVDYNGSRVSDVICTFENRVTEIASWPFQSWQSNYDYSRFYFLVHTAPTVEDMYYSLNEALSRRYGWFYCTTDTMANPWDDLPPYMTAMRKAVKAVSEGTSPAITVDGSTSEWNVVEPLAISNTTVQTFKMTNSDSILYFLIQGTGLDVTSNIYLNTDNNTATGYSASTWRGPNGCDFMIENNVLYKNNGGGWSWTPVATLTASQFVRNDGVIEVGVPLSLLEMANCAYIHAGFVKNSSGDQLPKAGASMIYRALRQ